MPSEKIVYCNNMELESQEEYGCVGATTVKKAHKQVVAMFLYGPNYHIGGVTILFFLRNQVMCNFS